MSTKLANVTLDHKTSHKGKFFEFEIYKINKLSIDVWFVRIGQYLAEIQLFENLESEGAKKNRNIEKITFKVVQIKFNAYYWSKIRFWYIYGRKFTKYLHGTWSLLNILMIFGKKKILPTLKFWIYIIIYILKFDADSKLLS